MRLVRTRLLDLHYESPHEQAAWRNESTSFVREYVDNETQLVSKPLHEDVLQRAETYESLPVGPRDKLPFGMNIKKAAFQVAPIDEKTRQVLEQYQNISRSTTNRGKEAEELLDDLLSDELSSNDSVSCSSSSDDIDLKMDLEQLSCGPASKGGDKLNGGGFDDDDVSGSI